MWATCIGLTQQQTPVGVHCAVLRCASFMPDQLIPLLGPVGTLYDAAFWDITMHSYTFPNWFWTSHSRRPRHTTATLPSAHGGHATSVAPLHRAAIHHWHITYTPLDTQHLQLKPSPWQLTTTHQLRETMQRMCINDEKGQVINGERRGKEYPATKDESVVHS